MTKLLVKILVSVYFFFVPLPCFSTFPFVVIHFIPFSLLLRTNEGPVWADIGLCSSKIMKEVCVCVWRKDMMIDKWFETCTSIFQIGTYVENRNQLKKRKNSWLGNGKLYIPIYVPVSWSKWSIAITSKLPLPFPLLSFLILLCEYIEANSMMWSHHITYNQMQETLLLLDYAY